MYFHVVYSVGMNRDVVFAHEPCLYIDKHLEQALIGPLKII